MEYARVCMYVCMYVCVYIYIYSFIREILLVFGKLRNVLQENISSYVGENKLLNCVKLLELE
jgi:hypothetical protein